MGKGAAGPARGLGRRCCGCWCCVWCSGGAARAASSSGKGEEEEAAAEEREEDGEARGPVCGRCVRVYAYG